MSKPLVYTDADVKISDDTFLPPIAYQVGLL